MNFTKLISINVLKGYLVQHRCIAIFLINFIHKTVWCICNKQSLLVTIVYLNENSNFPVIKYRLCDFKANSVAHLKLSQLHSNNTRLFFLLCSTKLYYATAKTVLFVSKEVQARNSSQPAVGRLKILICFSCCACTILYYISLSIPKNESSLVCLIFNSI